MHIMENSLENSICISEKEQILGKNSLMWWRTDEKERELDMVLHEITPQCVKVVFLLTLSYIYVI